MNLRGQPRVVVEVTGYDGRPHPIEAIVDTGFGGDLLLPTATIRALRLRFQGEASAILADGQETSLPRWSGSVFWHGRQRNAQILEARGEPLLGTNLLHGSRVTLDMLENGDVIIDELGPK